MISRPKVAVAIAVFLFGYAAFKAAFFTAPQVVAGPYLPRWDIAYHTIFAWELYDYLVSFNLPMFFWTFWLETRWPTVNAFYQIPFYITFGPSYASAIYSAAFTYATMGVIAATYAVNAQRRMPLTAAAMISFFALTSPVYLAYATIPMLEITGALSLVTVLAAYLISRENSDPRYAKLFALSLTILFFTKYNYFLMAIIPLAVFEWSEQTAGISFRDRVMQGRALILWLLSSWTGRIVVIYTVIVSILTMTGRMKFELFGQKIVVSGVGASGIFFLFFLLWRLIKAHRAGQIDWSKIWGVDHRLKPFAVWFLAPISIWLSTPYPNHMNGFFEYFYVHKNLNPRSLAEGVAYYLDELSQNYFYNEWLFYGAAALFVFALFNYNRQLLGGRIVIVCGAITLAMVFTHQMKESRFLFLVMIPFWGAAALEGTRLLGKISSNRLFDMAVAIVITISALFLFDSTVNDERFKKLSLIQYTKSEEMDKAFAAVRKELSDDARLGILGKSDVLSPALYKWQLGAPQGFRHYQNVIEPDELHRVEKTTHLLLVAVIGSSAGLLSLAEIEKSYPVYKAKVDRLVTKKRARLVKEFPIKSKKLLFTLYELNSQARQ